MKKKFIFLLSLISLLFLSGCDLLDSFSSNTNNNNNNTSTTTKETNATTTNNLDEIPSFNIICDDYLTFDKENKNYNLLLYVGESYNFKSGIDEKYLDNYKIEYGFIDYINVDENNNFIAKELQGEISKLTLNSNIRLINKSTNKTIETIKIKIEVRYKDYDVKISFNKGDMNYDRTSSIPWFFNLKYNETFEIKPKVEGIEGYHIEYTSTNTEININNNVVSAVNATETTEKTCYIRVFIYDKYNKKQDNNILIRCVINGTKLSDNIDYIGAEFEYGEDTDLVKLNKEHSYRYEYSIPYENYEYELPTITLKNIDISYKIKYEVDSRYNHLSFREEDGKVYAYTDSQFFNYFSVVAYTLDNERIIAQDFSIKATHIGKGEFVIKDINSNEIYKDGDTIDIYQNDYLDLNALFNNRMVNYNDTEFNVSIESGDSISISKTKLVINAINPGTSVLVYEYEQKDATDTLYKYQVKLTINVTKRKLQRIYLPYPDNVVINGSDITINGSIMAEYDGNYFVKINGKDNLSFNAHDTDNENIKELIIKYVDDGITKECSYLIDITKTATISKENLDDNLEKLWANREFKITPLTGNVRVLVIPVWFSDSVEFINDNQKNQILTDLNTMLFDTSNNVKYRSLRQYYQEESYGRLNLYGEVKDWYNLGLSYKNFSALSSSSTKTIADSAVTWYFEHYLSETKADYDLNSDGIIDALMLYYGSPYVGNPTTDNEYIQNGRAYVAKTKVNSYVNQYAFISSVNMYNLTYNKNAKEIMNNNDDLKAYSGGLDSKTTIHEFGHMIGATDYYDDNITASYPAGGFSMQDNNKGSHDPYTIVSYGWAKPYILESSSYSKGYTIDITLNDFVNSGDVLFLTRSWNNTLYDEFIVIELFIPEGLNKYDSNSGLNNVGFRIWHVNAVLNDEKNAYKYSNDTIGSSIQDNTDIDLLHYIRNDVSSAYGKDAKAINNTNLFYANDEFTLEKYESQFINKTKLDNGSELGFKVVFDTINVNSDGSANSTLHITVL